MSNEIYYDKKIFAENLERLMKQRDEKQIDIAQLLKVSKSTVSDYCKGKQMPRMDKIEMLALHFGVLKSELLEEQLPIPDNIMPMPQTYKVPRLGVIACGEPILAEQNIECYDAVPDYIKCDFTLICKGDSMINARIFDGDIVCIKQQPIVESGEIAAVLVGDEEATLKRIYIYVDKIILQPENPSYPPFVYVGDEMNNVRILGKATHFISAVR